MRYPLEEIAQEVAFVAYHFHWSPQEILNLEHRQRQQWVKEIAKINRRFNESVR